MYNASHADGAHNLESQMRVFRDDGQEVLRGDRRTIDWPGPGGTGSLTGGTFSLPPALPPGAYLLHLSVTDPLADKKRDTATQAVAFEVAP